MIDAPTAENKSQALERHTVYPLNLVHRLVFFRGFVFEFGVGKTRRDFTIRYSKVPADVPGVLEHVVKWDPESAGNSCRTLEDAEKFTKQYGEQHAYNLVLDNCHDFFNRLADYLSGEEAKRVRHSCYLFRLRSIFVLIIFLNNFPSLETMFVALKHTRL